MAQPQQPAHSSVPCRAGESATAPSAGDRVTRCAIACHVTDYCRLTHSVRSMTASDSHRQTSCRRTSYRRSVGSADRSAGCRQGVVPTATVGRCRRCRVAAAVIIPAAAACPSAGSATGAYNPAAAPRDGVGGRRIEDTLTVGRVALVNRSRRAGLRSPCGLLAGCPGPCCASRAPARIRDENRRVRCLVWRGWPAAARQPPVEA